MIYLDFETRSTVKLKVTGLGPYAEDDSTEVMCMVWAIDDGEPELWHIGHERLGIEATTIPLTLIQAIRNGHNVEAHNAAFERALWGGALARDHVWAACMWEDYLFEPESWRCSAALAASYALPRSLDGAAKALRLKELKDESGKGLIQAAQRQNKEGEWTITWDKVTELHYYCLQDVVVEREISKALRPLSASEQRLWEADRRMNERGVYVDMAFAQRGIEMRAHELERLKADMWSLTNGAVKTATNRIGLKAWCAEHGLDLPNMQAATITEALKLDDLEEHIRQAITIYQRANKNSVAKYKKVVVTANSQSRVINTMLFHGANTGRWSGVGLQPQNLPRGFSPKVGAEVARDAMELSYDDFSLIYGSAIETLSKSVRALIMASPGHSLYVADYASIEARVLCWLACEEESLELFRMGGDVYKDMASSIFNVPYEEVTGDQRFLGKQAILGLGYGMGALKFRDTVKARTGMVLPLKFFKDVVIVYRKERYTKIWELWNTLEEAACEAVRTRQLIKQGYFRWKVSGRFLHCRLPSGRLLSYPEPYLAERRTWLFKAFTKDKELTWIVVKGTIKSDTPPVAKARKQAAESEVVLSHEKPSMRDGESLVYWTSRGYGNWMREETYGGKLAENVTQAVARDVMAEALVRADEHPIYNQTLITVHDELVVEVPNGKGELKEFEELVGQVPLWAPGLPVDVEGWTGKRYGK